jgi:hypothetical protein
MDCEPPGTPSPRLTSFGRSCRRPTAVTGVYLQGSDGAHAIALRHGRDNRYHLFDPNYFHIAIKGKDTFKAYVDSYLTMSGYDKEFEKKTGVVGVKPPINVGH